MLIDQIIVIKPTFLLFFFKLSGFYEYNYSENFKRNVRKKIRLHTNLWVSKNISKHDETSLVWCLAVNVGLTQAFTMESP